MNYYGRFYRSALYPLLKRINAYLVRWPRKKYKRLRAFKKSHVHGGKRSRNVPAVLRALGTGSRDSGDQDDKSRVTGDCYARSVGARGFPQSSGQLKGLRDEPTCPFMVYGRF